MSFMKYLKDNLKLILFYFILMSFISFTIYFDRNNRVLYSNLIYIEFVSFFMFLLYLFLDYFSKYRYIKKLLELEKSQDKTPILPPPEDCKDELYSSMINNLYEEYSNKVDAILHNVTENQEFMTVWVHEIKTPITTSKLLLDSGQDNFSRVDLLSLKEELLKIDDYVEKALYYSRSDSFSKDYIITDVDLNKLIKESIKRHSVIFIKKNIKLSILVDENFTVDSDRKWLLFIVDQLLSNALKYTSKDGQINFKTMSDDKEKILIIEDNGCGIKEEDMQRLFTKSYTGFNGRLHNTKATGFGLYLSQKLSKKLGHYITIESKYNSFTKVYLHFPKWNDYYEVTKM